MIRNDLQSRTIEAMRLFLILCVVVVHAYTSTRVNIDTDHYPVYRFVSFLLSLNIAQVAIPGFFFFSGYLYFHSTNSYPEHLHNDWKRLAVPYLIWNSVILVLYWGLEGIPSLSGMLSGENMRVHDYGWRDLIRAFWDGGQWDNGNGSPVLHQLWYIRNLLIMCVLSPLVKKYIQWTGVVGVALLVAWWIFTPHLGLLSKSVAFFTLGAWFSIGKRDFVPMLLRHTRAISGVYILLVAIVMICWHQPWSGWLNRVGSTVGIFFFTALTAQLLLHYKSIRIPTEAAGLTFFIFVAHDPMIILMRRLLLRTMPATDTWITIGYFLSTLAVLGICTGAYYLMRQWQPRLMWLLVGSRTTTKTACR